MLKTKYIIFDTDLLTPVVFPDTLIHVDVAKALGYPVISAGFCEIIGDKYECYGESVSLNVKSRYREDSEILNRMLNLINLRH